MSDTEQPAQPAPKPQGQVHEVGTPNPPQGEPDPTAINIDRSAPQPPAQPAQPVEPPDPTAINIAKQEAHP